MTHTHFQIKQLRAQNVVTLLMSLTLFLAALFTIALLPSLLIRYMYAEQTLTAQPPLLDIIPLVAFAIAKIYFLYAVVVVTLRELKARKLEKMAYSMDCDCNCGTGHGHSHGHDDMSVSEEELAELESIVEKAVNGKKPAAKSKKVTRKVTKASAKKN